MADLTQLQSLIQEGKLDEASAVLKTYLDEPASEEVQGEALVTLASLFLEVKNAMNDRRIEALNEALAILKELDAQAGDAKLEGVKDRLGLD